MFVVLLVVVTPFRISNPGLDDYCLLTPGVVVVPRTLVHGQWKMEILPAKRRRALIFHHKVRHYAADAAAGQWMS